MIKNRMITCFAMILWQVSGFAAFEQPGGGARFMGMGNASVGLKDFWAIHHNQAGLAYLRGITFGLSAHNHYLINELNQASAALALPMKKAGVIGLSVDDFGISFYRENTIGLSYAMAFGTGFSVGLRLNYMRSTFRGDHGDQNYVGFDLGVMFQPSKGLVLAVHASNPITIKFPFHKEERLVSGIAIGISHQISDEVLLSLECEKITGRKPRFKTGIEYAVKEKLYLRSGIQSHPFQFAFGSGYSMGRLCVDIATSYHRFLGFSPQLSIHYIIKMGQ